MPESSCAEHKAFNIISKDNDERNGIEALAGNHSLWPDQVAKVQIAASSSPSVR